MEEEAIRVVELQPMRVVVFRAIGVNPEEDAGRRLTEWAAARGIVPARGENRVLGFDVCDGEGAPDQRGYEFWLVVGPEAASDPQVPIKESPGGQYAVLRCAVDGDPFAVIPSSWQKLVDLCTSAGYTLDDRECLEECIEWPIQLGHFTLDLHLPVNRAKS